ncbi:MAG: class I SAM-dependent methyltransferase [Pseudomonadales bacterium]|nr:class I SAM-dependent methyltransferase [Pseudomonadales bacterium]
MTQEFKNHFSAQAEAYRRYRPTYPAALFEWLAKQAPSNQLAWDCATGNGQAAVGLADYFESVIATDGSETQIAQATRHPKIQYQQAVAETNGLKSNDFDLITVAQALHWFDLPKFFNECQRLLKPKGIVAVWSYDILRLTPQINKITDHFYSDVVGSYWPPGRERIDEGYETLEFPFNEFDTPQFNMSARWSLEHFIQYFSTWSAVQRYKEHNKTDPVEQVKAQFEQAWGDPEQLQNVHWSITLRVGSVKS